MAVEVAAEVYECDVALARLFSSFLFGLGFSDPWESKGRLPPPNANPEKRNSRPYEEVTNYHCSSTNG